MQAYTSDYLIPVFSVGRNDDRATALNPAKGVPAMWSAVSAGARVPEHSAPFMAAMSGGSAMVINGYLFFIGEDWITCVGYPLDGAYSLDSFIFAADLAADHLALVLRKHGEQREGIDMFAVAPHLPASAIRELGGETSGEDHFYILPASAPVPTALRGPVRQAHTLLRVEEGLEFTAAHRRLWSEMLARPDMSPNVREMYAKTGFLMEKGVSGTSFLNAWDAAGELAASLLIDCAPEKFCAYIIGAHSRRHYSPHATDLLFSVLLEKARALGKEYIHLGLGVNKGILRFKKKWGGYEDLPFMMARWKHFAREEGLKENFGGLFKNMVKSGGGMTKQEMFNALPEQRPFAMLWELEKNGKKSWIGGTAHFFYYSFTMHFEKLFGQVDNVIFEGPMDEGSMALFTQSGRTRQKDDPDLLALLSKKELRELKYMVEGSANPVIRRLNAERHAGEVSVEYYLENYRPWYAFFSMWTAFLERRGWSRSVDLEAWNLARDMGKAVIAMETHEEQLASLSSVPAGRIVNFFRQCHEWPRLSRANLRSYLNGDLGGMYGTSTEFPTRGVHGVFGARDLRFTERVLPFVERGGCIAFVGSAHMLGMRELLRREGVRVTKVFPSRLHRFKCGIIKKFNGDKSDFE